MVEKITYVTFLLVTLLTLNFHLTPANAAAEEEHPWSKYPDNSEVNFRNVDSFYESLDKNQYVEYENAKINIREKTYFKDINKVFSKVDKSGKTRAGGSGFHPKRQVYVFVSVSYDGKKIKTAVFDAEKQRLISSSSDL